MLVITWKLLCCVAELTAGSFARMVDAVASCSAAHVVLLLLVCCRPGGGFAGAPAYVASSAMKFSNEVVCWLAAYGWDMRMHVCVLCSSKAVPFLWHADMPSLVSSSALSMCGVCAHAMPAPRCGLCFSVSSRVAGWQHGSTNQLHWDICLLKTCSLLKQQRNWNLVKQPRGRQGTANTGRKGA